MTPRLIAFPPQSEVIGCHDEWKPVPVLSALPSPGPIAEKKADRPRVLVAEDDPVSCRILTTRLASWNYEPVETHDGHQAMMALRDENSPKLAILDWMMPGMDGLEVCRRVRQTNRTVYIIFLTARAEKENLFEALEAGADDYLVKPFCDVELLGRIHVGFRIINLQETLLARVKELEASTDEVISLRDRLQIPL